MASAKLQHMPKGDSKREIIIWNKLETLHIGNNTVKSPHETFISQIKLLKVRGVFDCLSLLSM